MSDTVDWELARRIGVKVASRQPFATSYLSDELVSDFDEFTAEAEELVAAETGLRSLSGSARGRVTDRAGWIDANLASFQRLLRPLLEKMEAKAPEHSRVAPVARRFAGAELGAILGWMSTRVLGQYDLLVIEDEDPDDQDIVYYVGPNVVALERRFAFPPREFRLWLALHEVTHRAQFTGIPWLREHFLGLVGQTLDSVDPDPKRVLEAIRQVVEARKAGEDPMANGGVMALLASPAQRDVLDQISGMMSLLEGHGDITMDRAGADRIPSAERFGRVLRNRRQSARGLTAVLQRVIGLDAKIKQYAQGEAFIEAVEDAGGPELLEQAWSSPEFLPSIAEIRAPELWIARIGTPQPLLG